MKIFGEHSHKTIDEVRRRCECDWVFRIRRDEPKTLLIPHGRAYYVEAILKELRLLPNLMSCGSVILERGKGWWGIIDMAVKLGHRKRGGPSIQSA